MLRWTLALWAVTVAGLVGCASATGLQPGEDASTIPDASSLSVCGNGVVEGDEVCDDGNTADGDDCRADCGQDLTLCGNRQADPGEECDDGNTEDGDGCTAQCQFPGCDPGSCVDGCCDLTGTCQDGTQDMACGSGGAECQSCLSLGQVCEDHACRNLGQCVPEETRPCGHCGTRTCAATGQWGTCEDQGACQEGVVEITGSCGNCGVLQRTCQADCTWGALSCENEGECAQGEEEVGAACGACAKDVRVCQSDCTWGDWVCQSYEECTPQEVESGGSCGNCGVLQRTCQTDCTWGDWACAGEGPCQAGASRDCRDCGIEACGSDCAWSGQCSPHYACAGSEICNAEAYCVSPCGNGLCDAGEDCGSCSQDCGDCGSGGFQCHLGCDGFNNMCHMGPNAVGLPQTHPGGYCDPDGNGDFGAGDWVQGYYDYCGRCPTDPECNNAC